MVTSLKEFLVEIDKKVFPNGHVFSSTTLPWFRGQADQSWSLVPGIYRNNGNSEYEREMVRDFKLTANLKIQRMTESNLEILFLMQHYGMPTRLLDWTESHLIALYFALIDFKNPANAAVWGFMPREYNNVILPLTTFGSSDSTVPVSSDKRLTGYTIDIENIVRLVKEKWPLAIRPVRTSDRITSQKGMFTIHGHLKKGLEKIIKESNEKNAYNKIPLIKIEIDGSCRIKILRELYAAGISHSVLFPELEGISQEIAFRYSKEFTTGSDGHTFYGFK